MQRKQKRYTRGRSKSQSSQQSTKETTSQKTTKQTSQNTRQAQKAAQVAQIEEVKDTRQRKAATEARWDAREEEINKSGLMASGMENGWSDVRRADAIGNSGRKGVQNTKEVGHGGVEGATLSLAEGREMSHSR